MERIGNWKKKLGAKMIKKIKNKVAGKISNIVGATVRKEVIELLPLIPQLIEFQNSPKEDRQSYYDHTKDPVFPKS